MPAAQMRRSPRSSGEGRLRASLAVSLSHSRAYSASRCRAQNARLIAVIPLKTRRIAGRELRDLARIGKARHGWHPPWISALGLAPNLPRLLGSGGAQPRDRPLSPSTIAERCQRVSGPWDQKGGTSSWRQGTRETWWFPRLVYFVVVVREAGTDVSARQRGAGGHEVLAGLRHARGHRPLGLGHVGARVEGLLDADAAVDPQDAVVVAEHVVGDRPGESILGVGVDVHLHRPVGDRLADLAQQRAGPAVEHQVKRLVPAGAGAHGPLDVVQDPGAQLDVSRLVDAVDVAERGGQDVAAALAGAEHLGGAQRVLGRGVQLLVHLADDVVLLAADHPNLHLQDHLGLGAPG